MPRYIVIADGFSIGSTEIPKDSEVDLPGLSGDFGVANNTLRLFEDYPAEYSTRMMTPKKPRRARKTRVVVASEAEVVAATETPEE